MNRMSFRRGLLFGALTGAAALAARAWQARNRPSSPVMPSPGSEWPPLAGAGEAPVPSTPAPSTPAPAAAAVVSSPLGAQADLPPEPTTAAAETGEASLSEPPTVGREADQVQQDAGSEPAGAPEEGRTEERIEEELAADDPVEASPVVAAPAADPGLAAPAADGPSEGRPATGVDEDDTGEIAVGEPVGAAATGGDEVVPSPEPTYGTAPDHTAASEADVPVATPVDSDDATGTDQPSTGTLRPGASSLGDPRASSSDPHASASEGRIESEDRGEPEVASWVVPESGACPTSHRVKATMASRTFHAPGDEGYDETTPDRCYLDVAAAEAEGLARAGA